MAICRQLRSGTEKDMGQARAEDPGQRSRALGPQTADLQPKEAGLAGDPA